MKIEETWFSQNLFEYSKTRFYKALRVDDSLKKLNRLVPDINEGFPSLQSLITGASTTTENLSRNCNSPCVPFLLYSIEVGNIMRRKGLLDPTNDKMRLPVLLNSPSIFGGLPLSNLYQHCQRGCPDPLTIWVKIWQIIRIDYYEVFQILQKAMPCTIKIPMDPIRLIEDMYSLNITSLPNFERRAREIVEEFLPNYVTNPHVVRLLGASREDLERLCNILITMNPYIANLAHEILRNSNEGVQLQLIGSFTNLQTINRMINEQPEEQDTIFQAGLIKDKEAVQTLIKRFTDTNKQSSCSHVIADLIDSENCSFSIASQAREATWGFPITGITSPVPCEQISIQDYDQSSEVERSDCIIAKVSYQLKTLGRRALMKRGPYTPYLGSSTPEKMTKPKLTVTCPNPNVKSIRKLYYIMTYLIRMDPRSELIGLLRKMIDEKLVTLPRVFQSVPLEDWCGKNYGGSYEHRFKASSQKRSALYALTTNLATHMTLNTNQLGKALRGNEDYNLFFQEIFLFIQNYIAEVAIRGFKVYDTYAIPLKCKNCTYQIVNKPISLGVEVCDYKSKMMVELPKSSLSCIDLTPCVRICTVAMSVSIGRRLTQTRLHESEVHDAREAYGNSKTEDSSDRMSSNFMSEFRSCDLNYVFVGALQSSKQLRDYVLSESTDYPGSFFEHLAYLIINSERLPEIAVYLELRIEKHSSVTQVSGLAKVLAHGFRTYVSTHLDLFFRACTFSFFKSDLISNHSYWWRVFLVKLLTDKNTLSKIQLAGVKRIPTLGGDTTCEWNKRLSRDERKHLTLEIPYDENDAISVWRDLKGMINELVGPTSPLSDKIKTRESKKSIPPLPSTSKRNRDTFLFNPHCLEKIDGSNCPIWTRYIHHICRVIGKISTSASKMLQVLDYYPEVWKETGLIVALAEGSGGILHTLAHTFPESKLIYNTLQTDTVELKENALNCEPPAFIGDTCDLLERLQGLRDLCLGESDITQPVFVEKITSLLRRLNENISIWSMDAELKTDMSNFDKIETYLPLVNEFLSENGILVNKMFLFNPDQISRLRSTIRYCNFVCNIHKPASSHPHNNEFYVTIFRETSGHPKVQDIIGESHIGKYLLTTSDKKLMKLHQYRLTYFKHLTSKMRNDLLSTLFNHPCISALRRSYDPTEITIHFLTYRHHRNLILMILNIEFQQLIVNEATDISYPIDFVSKDVLNSLLVLSVSLGSCRTPEQVVSVLDTLSHVRPVSNIIPGKGLEMQIVPIDAFSDGNDSVIGILNNKIKDLMRTINFFTTKIDSVPQLSLADKSIPQTKLETIRKTVKTKLLDIVVKGESGYTAFLKIRRGELEQ